MNNQANDVPPTERTALLPSRRTDLSVSLPAISPALACFQAYLIEHRLQDAQFFDEYNSQISSASARVAFQLIIYLQLKRVRLQPVNDPLEGWVRGQTDVVKSRDLDHTILRIWEEWIKCSRSGQDVEAVLWARFPVNDGGDRYLTVADLVSLSDGSDLLISHPLVVGSFIWTWKAGRTAPGRADETVAQRTLRHFDAMATPRILHSLDVSLFLGYITFFVSVVIHPPISNAKSTVSDIVLGLYALASITRQLSVQSLPFVIVLAVLLLSWPSFPDSNNTGYTLLLVSLCLHVLLLHVPQAPSPVFVLSPAAWVPMSTLLWLTITRIFYPAVLFFLPTLVLSAILLSLSLAENIFTSLTSIVLDPAPYETRATFLSLFGVTAVLLVALLSTLVLISPSSPSPSSTSSWDRYSIPVGLRSRRYFATALKAYNSAYHFPPPVNLLQLLLVILPSTILRASGKKGSSSYVREVGDRLLWRVTVGPLAVLVAAVWIVISRTSLLWNNCKFFRFLD